MEQSLTEIKIEIKNSTKIVGDFNTSFSIVNKRTRQMISKGLEDLENAINQLDQIEVNLKVHFGLRGRGRGRDDLGEWH